MNYAGSSNQPEADIEIGRDRKVPLAIFGREEDPDSLSNRIIPLTF
jgi:hypothetical protein